MADLTLGQLALRHAIMRAFAETGAAPRVEDGPELRELAERHLVVLAGDERTLRIHMAHPFAGHREGARVDARGRRWWGNCAWDGFGIAAALGLRQATVTSNGIAVELRDGVASGDAVFHIAVPARAWWDDIGFT